MPVVDFKLGKLAQLGTFLLVTYVFLSIGAGGT